MNCGVCVSIRAGISGGKQPPTTFTLRSHLHGPSPGPGVRTPRPRHAPAGSPAESPAPSLPLRIRRAAPEGLAAQCLRAAGEADFQLASYVPGPGCVREAGGSERGWQAGRVHIRVDPVGGAAPPSRSRGGRGEGSATPRFPFAPYGSERGRQKEGESGPARI